MSTVETTNLGFNKIQDTVYDAKVMEGLSKLGVLPNSFQVRQCTVTLTGLAIGAAVIQALIDDHTGLQIQFIAGQQVILLRAGASTLVATEANLDAFTIGLAATATGAVAETLVTTATGGEVLNAAGLNLVPTVAGAVIGATNIYGVIATTVTTLALTAGVIKIVIVTI